MIRPLAMATLLSAALLVGCGGAGAEQSPAATAGPAAGPAGPAAVAAAAEDTGGLARQGEACDYGGAERYTCTGGLECCYGEHAGPNGYGTCQAECNWD